jgi:hypothetical protein
MSQKNLAFKKNEEHVFFLRKFKKPAGKGPPRPGRGAMLPDQEE